MYKCIIFVTNFKKSPSAGGLSTPSLLTFDIGDLMLRDLAKSCKNQL